MNAKDEREKLIKELQNMFWREAYDLYSVESIADFILADRMRVVEPLVKWYGLDRVGTLIKAIDQTLKNAGVIHER